MNSESKSIRLSMDVWQRLEALAEAMRATPGLEDVFGKIGKSTALRRCVVVGLEVLEKEYSLTTDGGDT